MDTTAQPVNMAVRDVKAARVVQAVQKKSTSVLQKKKERAVIKQAVLLVGRSKFVTIHQIFE